MPSETLSALPISGGWGYGPEDAIIIEDDDAMESMVSDYDININSRQTTIDSLIHEQHKEQHILATMHKLNPHITEPKRYCFMSDIDHFKMK